MSDEQRTEDVDLADREQKLAALKARQQECVAVHGGHLRVATLDTKRGWHEGHCERCGMDMSYDSGD
jgi:hypothetical protein